MKIVIASITIFIALSYSAMSQEMMSHMHHMDSTKAEKPIMHKHHMDTTKVVKYTCLMHPDVIMNKPGKCPKCGMTLVKVDAKKAEIKKTKEIKAEVYTCPMHSDVKSDKPGKCPQCGMTLVKEKEYK
jgi:hypothetical protein